MVNLVRSAFVCAGMMVAGSAAQAADAVVIGRVAAVTGSPTAAHAHDATSSVRVLMRGDEVHQGDILETPKGATLRVLMNDKSLLDLGDRSRVSLNSYRVVTGVERKASIKLWVGKLWARVSSTLSGEKSFDVTTPNAVAGIRGTSFGMNVTEGGDTELLVEDGSVEFGNDAGTQMFGALTFGTLGADGQLTLVQATPEQVQALQSATEPDSNPPEGGTPDATAGEGDSGEGDSGDGDSSDSGPGDANTTPPIDLDPAQGLDGQADNRVDDNLARLRGIITVEQPQ